MSNLYLFVITFSYFFFAGYPFVRSGPVWTRTMAMFVFFSPIFGFAALCLVVPFVLLYSSSIDLLAYSGLLLGVIGFACFCRDRVLWRELWRERNRAMTELVLAGGTALFLIFLGINPRGKISTAYLNGVDVAGYSATATYLRDWKGFEDLERKLSEALKIEDITIAKANNDMALDTQLVITSEFILKAYRWSYPAILAATSNLFGVDSVYRLNYIFLGLAAGALSALSVLFARILGLAGWRAPMVALCVSLNCNLMNVVLQGQYAQFIAAPLFLLMLVIVFRHREGEVQSFSRGDFFLWTVVVAAFMSIYNEMLFTLIVFLVLLSFLDVIFNSRSLILRLWFACVPPTLLGMVLAWPVTWTWLGFLNKHLRNVRIGGWPQPHWATPPEILGLMNMYRSGFVTHEVFREFWEGTLGFLGVFILIPLCGLLFYRAGKRHAAFLGAGILFILLIFLKTKYIEDIHSYQYMKAYTFFLPVIAIGFFAKLLGSDRGGGNPTVFAVLACAMIVFSGVQYYCMARQESFHVTEAMFKYRNKEGVFRGPLWIQPANITTFIMVGIVPMRWLNQGPVKQVSGALDHEVKLVVTKTESSNQRESVYQKRWPLVFEDEHVSVFQTSGNLKDFSKDGIFSIVEPTFALTDFVDSL